MAANLFKPPAQTPTTGNPSVFLAGTIDNGNSADWQSELVEALRLYDVDLYNPRREEWDASWEQSIHNQNFKEQVTWELDHLDKCDIIFMHFVGGSQSPITLLELGLYAEKRPKNLMVVCSPDFWRKGNVEVIAERYGIPLYYDFTKATRALRSRLSPLIHSAKTTAP
ncbi:MAG: hypothetical protein GY833_22395 [Aestuariibacter sp.]|nr:hypothetical protein [Aestuariibacter sp.]|tara:strand:- start:274991 stop:275494 length:504 start_codon:yes stop_codon:yes gene_type:complete